MALISRRQFNLGLAAASGAALLGKSARRGGILDAAIP